MSADSPRRGLHKGAQVVSPQPISDRSIIDSVAGIINDIVPQAYAGAPNVDNKETITWARFEYADVNNSAFYPDYVEGSATPPLLLVLGYTTGVQVWVVGASGEATEVLSWRQWVVRTLRILPEPKTDEDNADPFHEKRPMVALCDSAGPGPQFCSVSFVSLRTGEQAKSIKFKNPVCDVLANRRSVVVTFSEKIAVFDARTLEDVLTVTTCYPSPGPNPNPVALGTRWLAYSEKKLLPARRSSGGSEGEGVQSYTAAVLYAAKSLGKGLRGLGETVASSLTGNSSTPMAMNNVAGDVTQPGVVTILDLQASKEEKDMDDSSIETVVAHFTAHNDAIVAMTFDLTGALLMTADKRGHDFHVFRIQPHPGGPTLAAVHHLYVLHRGDTTAKVQDMTFSGDTRWAAVSTVRGTTHVFPVAPYGGPVGVRTHSTPHVVNRLSRFHRSAGLTDDSARSHSPVSHAELPISVYPYTNPRLPPYPHPTILHPLAQIRQPSTLNHTNNQSQPRPQQRQRLHSDDGGTLQLKICACFAPPRAWIYAQRDSTSKVAKRAVDSLFIMACHGNMIQYDLEPKPAAGVPKEKVCDDTTIELEVEARGQWPLLRTPNSLEILTPLSSSSPLLSTLGSPKCSRQLDTADDRWLSQVEIVTHAGPHRRLWMGPQFVFKTYNAPSGVNLIESEAIEIGVTGGSRPARSNPVNMPHTAARPLVPLVIDGSGSSYEQSPRFMEAYGDSLENETMGIGHGENQLREDLAEAMLETSTAPHRVAGRRLVVERVGQPVTKVVNPLGTVITVMADEEDVSSSQEFDDPTPEPPRSLCAEEGPASLGDFDTERGQDLRNLTEICAEMRSASEPAIDSVPDEGTKEVRVTKTLCAEAVTVPSHHERTIDYESAEAFRDVPTSLSLCAEQGEIPNSPMTMARETNWTRRAIIRDENELQERNYAKAKYIVNYDDDSVVLMENKATSTSSVGSQRSVGEECPRPEVVARTTEAEPERASKRPSKIASSTRATKRSSCAPQPKYLVHEHEDSIVIEAASTDARSNDRPENVERKNGPSKSASLVEATRQSPTYETADKRETETRQRRVKERRNSKNSRILDAEAMVVESRRFENADNFVDLEACGAEALVIVETRENEPEPMEATVATGLAAIPLVETQLRRTSVISDDVSCMDYHIVETAFVPIRGETACSQQSDDDIEHIHSSEVTQMLEILDGKLTACREDRVSPVRERKGSAVSDDDMEHINGAELADDALEQTCDNLVRAESCERADLEDFSGTNYARASKSALSFDDDIEHVYHSEINELEVPAAKGVLDSPEVRAGTKKTQENASGKERSPSLRARGSRKRKDVVVIDSDNSEAEVTVIVKSTDSWNRSKTPDKDAIEDNDRGCPEAKESSNEQPSLQSLQSLPKKTRVRTSKGNATTIPPTTTTNASQKRQPPDMVEIIDIDAMQKAEMEVASSIVTPECKILEARHEANPPRSQKSRRSKKAHLDNNSTMMARAENIAPPEEVTPPRVREAEDSGKASWSAPREPDLVGAPSKAPEPRDTEAVLDVPETSKNENVEQASGVPVRKSTKSSESRKSLSVEEKVTGTKKRGKKSRVGANEVRADAPTNAAQELAPVVENNRDETSLPVASAAIPGDDTERTISSLGVPNDVKMTDETSAEYEPREIAAASTISKNRSPEPEVQAENEQETERRTDSDLDAQPERSSSSDDLNANVVPMDTEEDAAVREIAEKIGPNALSPSWPTVNKKNTRSKKKKRR